MESGDGENKRGKAGVSGKTGMAGLTSMTTVPGGGHSGLAQPPAKQPAEPSAEHPAGAHHDVDEATRTDNPDTGARSITEFLTDGSLAALAAELSALLGVRVELRDANGRLITPATGARKWRVVEAPLITGADVFPLRLNNEVLGALVVGPGDPKISGGAAAARERLCRAVDLVSRAAAELVDYEAELRNKLRELGVVYKLSALLSRAARVERILEVALDSALDVLGLDSGSIMLLREDADGIVSENEEDLVVKASRNLSRQWLENPLPLSRERQFDQTALRGEVVVCQDVATDPRILLRAEAAREGIAAAMNAGLIFQNKPLGVIRLYSHEPRIFTDSERRLLRGIAEQAAVAVEQSRLLRLKEEEERVQRQLTFAADVQRRMMPGTFPVPAGLDAAARWLPSLELSGDFYDVFDLNGHLALVIGDVVGKGIGAALMMSAVRASLRAFAQDLYDLDEIISRVNAAMCRDTRDSEFATLWYGVIDPATMRLTYCSAGHEPPMVVRPPAAGKPPSKADVEELGVGGMAVGIDREQKYQRGVFDLRPRDTIIAYTDGLIDARSFSGEKFGRQRLLSSVLKILAEEPGATAARVVELLQWEVRRFAGLSDRVDDETIVVVRVK